MQTIEPLYKLWFLAGCFPEGTSEPGTMYRNLPSCPTSCPRVSHRDSSASTIPMLDFHAGKHDCTFYVGLGPSGFFLCS